MEKSKEKEGSFLNTLHYHNTILKDYGTHDIKFYDLTFFFIFFQNGEIDCWPMECPPTFCSAPILRPGHCCPSCDNKSSGLQPLRYRQSIKRFLVAIYWLLLNLSKILGCPNLVDFFEKYLKTFEQVWGATKTKKDKVEQI